MIEWYCIPTNKSPYNYSVWFNKKITCSILVSTGYLIRPTTTVLYFWILL